MYYYVNVLETVRATTNRSSQLDRGIIQKKITSDIKIVSEHIQ
jgi:hypothetical protein